MSIAASLSRPWIRHSMLAVLLMLAVWLAVKLIIALTSPSSLWEPVFVKDPVVTASAGAISRDFSYNPFVGGNRAVEDVPVVDAGDDAPETTLNLELKGLRSGENGTAFIRTPDGQEDNVYIGDEIMPNVFLRGVFPDYVLIDVNGQTQRLTTEDAKASRSGQTRGAAPRSGLQTLQTADASTFLSQVQIIPNFDQQMNRNGVVLKPRTSAISLSTYGLQDGDVITRIAGQSVVSGLPDIVALRRSIGSGRPVIVDLIRDGQPLSITIGSSS